ncbi:MAG: protoglobin domain-containing protein [Gemmataceae bacterium]
MQKTIYQRYQALQDYVGWTEADAARVRNLAPKLQPVFPKLVEDFYNEIQRHPEAHQVIIGGNEQIQRLKRTLADWLRKLVTGQYDEAYVIGRWKVGLRHVEIGLSQVFTNAALSRLRSGICQGLQQSWDSDLTEFAASLQSINKLLDLDLAIIECAYQEENLLRVRERSEATFRTLVEAAPCMIIILQPASRIHYFSPGARSLTGYSEGEVLGRDVRGTLFPHHRKDDPKLHSLLDGCETAQNYECEITHRDGLPRWILWNSRHLHDYEGSPAMLVVGHDLTIIKEAQERAVQAERLAAIGEMVTGLAHESGNALARSQACLEMLSLEVDTNPDALDLIQRIQDAQDHLRQLYDDVRGYAAPVQLDQEVWDIAGVWRQAWRNLQHLHNGRDVRFTEITTGTELRCPVDNFRLEQVFRNIFENALAACKDPVEISVRCRSANLDNNPALEITVEDNGPGMTAQQRRRIFHPFFTTKTKGTGLGMAIAKRIINAHLGTIVVESEEGEGARIIITLPRET